MAAGAAVAALAAQPAAAGGGVLHLRRALPLRVPHRRRDPRRRPEVALAVRVVHATPGRIPLGAPIVLKTVLRRDEVERAREEVAEDECNYEEVQHLEVVLRHDERVLEAREHPVHPQKLEDLERPHESHRLEELKVPHEVHVAIEAPPLVVRLPRRRHHLRRYSGRARE